MRKLAATKEMGKGRVKASGIKEEWRLFSFYNSFCLSGGACIIYIGCETYGRATKRRAVFLCLASKDV